MTQTPTPRRRTFTRFATILTAFVAVALLTATFFYINGRSANITYYSKASLPANVVASWSTTRDGLGAPPANFTGGDTFVIQNTHSMTTAAAWSISGANSRLQIENGGTLTATSAVTLNAATTFQIDNGGTYVQNVAMAMGSNIFQGTEVLGASSNIIIQVTPSGTSTPSSPGYGNLTFNITTGSTAFGWGASIPDIQGNFTIQSTGSTATVEQRMTNSGNLTMNIGGNLSITGGTLNLSNGAGIPTVNVGGSYIQSGGTLTSTGSGIATINYTGGTSFVNFTRTAGTLTTTNINWSIANGKTVQFDNAFTNAASRSFTIDSGGILLAAATITNSGTFTVNGDFRLTDGGFATGTNFVYGANGILSFTTAGNYGVDGTHVYWPTTNGPQNVNVIFGGITLNAPRTVGGLFQYGAGVSGATNLTLNGTSQVNTGGFTSGSPTYGASSLLRYNTGGTYGRNGEWLPGATSGAGYPANVQLSNTTTLDLPNSSTNMPFELSGNLTVDSNSKLQMAGATPLTQALNVRGNVTLSGNLELSTSIGGDLKVGGNLSTSNPGLTANNRAVIFNGTLPQTVGSAPLFDFVVVQNPAGVSSNGGIISVNKDFTVAPGAAFTSTIVGGFGSLIMQPGSTFINNGAVSADLLVNRSALNLSGVQINTVLQMHPGSAVNTTGPTYGASSTLLYIAGGTFNRGAEWSATSGAGYPANVRLQGPATVEMGANGGAATARQLAGSLQVETGSIFQMAGANPMTASVTALGGIFNNGTISLSTLAGGDLRSGGDLNNAYLNPNAPGTINGNGQRLHFVGGAVQNVVNGNAASITLPSLVVDKSGGVLQPSVDVVVNPSAAGQGISFQTAQSALSLLGKTLTLNDGGFSSVAGSGFLSSPGASAGSLVINGSGDAGTLPVAGQSLNQLTVNRTGAGGNVTLGGTVHIGGTLTLTEGTITTGAANTLQLGDAATLARTNGSVVGNLKKFFGGAGSFTFPVSTAAGYAPVDAHVTAGAGDLTVSATDGKLPAITGADALNRYWTLAGSDITTNLTFHYNAADVSVTPPATEASYSLVKSGSGVLQVVPNSSTNASTHTATATGVTTFSDWTLATAASAFGEIKFAQSNTDDAETDSATHTVNLAVQRAGGTGGAVSVDYAVTDGTADGADYSILPATGTLNWANGDATDKTITVTVNGDTTVEPNETVNLSISNPQGGAVLGTPDTSTLTITNDDTAAPPPPAVVYVDDDFTGANGSDPDGAGPATSIGYDAFPTIQGGVSGVASGGTVNVAAGTYTENVTVSEPLTLNGAGVGVVTLRPALSGANPCAGASLCPGASNLILVQANNVTITGLTLDGDNPALTSGIVRGGADLDARNGIITNHTAGTFNNLEVHHATIKNIYLRGVYNSTGGAFNFHDNTVQNVQGEGASIGLFNFGGAGAFTNNTVSDCNDAIASNHSRGTTYTGNTVTTSASGIHTDNAGDGGGTPDTISGNTVTNSQQFGYGIWTFVPSNVVTVSNNTVTNVEVGLAASGGQGGSSTFTGNTVNGMSRANATGVYLTTDQFGFGQGNISVVFRSNTVTGNVDGFFLEANETDPSAQAAAPKLPASANLGDGLLAPGAKAKAKATPGISATSYTLNVAADFNRTTGNSSTGISKAGAGVLNLNFENNWWGCNAGPNQTGCQSVDAAADFAPWLILTVNASPNPIAPGGSSTVTADLRHNSDGAIPSSTVFIPPTPVAFSATNGTITPPNATTANGDAAAVFTSTSASSGTASATVDNQTTDTSVNVAAPSFSIDDVTHAEGDSGTTSYTFTVTKTGSTDLSASVDYATVDGTATSPSDFTAHATTTLNFTSAETTKQITVNVSGDTSVEPDETFTVQLSNASGASIADADGTGTITNDDIARPAPAVVYVDDNFTGANGTDPDGAGPATEIGYDAFPTINGGIGGVADPGTVNVYAGTYDEDVNVNKSVSLVGTEGAGLTNIRGPIGGDSATTVRINASNVTVAGFTITRLGNNTTDWNNPGLNSAGIAIQGQAITGALIRDNIITGNRTGLDINHSNGHTVRNNAVDFNRTGFLYRNQTDNQTVVENFITNNWTAGVLFLDGSGGTNVPVQSAAHSTFSNNNISANWYAQIVDRQTGGSLPAPGTSNLKNFRYNWFGTTSPVVTTANSAEPGYAAQIPVAYGGTATPPGGQPDIAGPASANFKYQPFLQSGTDTNVETTAGRGTFGFQGQQTNIVVTPGNQQGWVFADDLPGTGTGAGGFEFGPATPPLGAGSAFLTVDAQGRHILATAGHGGTRMDDVTTLSYNSYQDNNSNTVVAPSLQFDIDYDLTDGANTFMGRLAFEPYLSPAQGAVQQNVWQNWDGLSGNWYGTRTTVTVGNTTGIAQPCQPATPCTWQQVIALFPNAGVRNTPTSAVLFKVGGPWSPGFDGNVDNFRLGIGASPRIVYDFEPTPVPPSLSINDVTLAEGNAGETDFTFTVTLSRTFGETVTVDYATADGTATAPDDYTARTTTQLSFAPGETTKQLTVKVKGETLFEGDEVFVVNLSNESANATISDSQGTGTITNDDSAPAISINDVSVAEPDAAGTTDAVFTVSLSNASSTTVTVDYATADSTATAPDDYNAVSTTTLTFDPGQTSKTVSVAVKADALEEGAETFTVNLSNQSGNATMADNSGTGTITDPVAAGQMLVSEFRFRGATYAAGVDGRYDEYVELYNNTNSTITVGATDGSAGWTVAALGGDGTTAVPLVTIPGGTVIPPRAHYLVAYSDTPINPATGGYSLGGYATPDQFYTVAEVADNAGVALFRTATAANFTIANRLDAAGFSGHTGTTADLFREGAGLASPGANDGEYAFTRKLVSGTPQDTNDNAADFAFVSTGGGAYGGVQSILGAPGPEDSGQPVQRNGVIKAALIDGTASSTAPPNRVRSGQVQPGVPNAYGTLSIQRRFKNTTSLPVTRLRFRIVDITTLSSPIASSPQADLRVLSSTGVVTNSQGAEVVTVTGLTLEAPPAQANGGGLNSTLTVALPGNMLAPGSTIDVQFLLGVQEQGAFRFLVNVEALPGPESPSSSSELSNMKNGGTKTKSGRR